MSTIFNILQFFVKKTTNKKDNMHLRWSIAHLEFLKLPKFNQLFKLFQFQVELRITNSDESFSLKSTTININVHLIYTL